MDKKLEKIKSMVNEKGTASPAGINIGLCERTHGENHAATHCIARHSRQRPKPFRNAENGGPERHTYILKDIK